MVGPILNLAKRYTLEKATDGEGALVLGKEHVEVPTYMRSKSNTQACTLKTLIHRKFVSRREGPLFGIQMY